MNECASPSIADRTAEVKGRSDALNFLGAGALAADAAAGAAGGSCASSEGMVVAGAGAAGTAIDAANCTRARGLWGYVWRRYVPVMQVAQN